MPIGMGPRSNDHKMASQQHHKLLTYRTLITISGITQNTMKTNNGREIIVYLLKNRWKYKKA